MLMVLPKKLPKEKTLARGLVDKWSCTKQGYNFSTLVDMYQQIKGNYMYHPRSEFDKSERKGDERTVGRLLKKYGYKDGPSNSCAMWIFGERPATFTVTYTSPDPQKILKDLVHHINKELQKLQELI